MNHQQSRTPLKTKSRVKELGQHFWFRRGGTQSISG